MRRFIKIFELVRWAVRGGELREGGEGGEGGDGGEGGERERVREKERAP